ncbi:MAG: alpha/beta fold hydrolase [Nocardioidaceae bacterium]
MTTTFSLETPEATLNYDVRGPLPPTAGRPALLLVAAPMDSSGFGTLASYLQERTVVTYDPRGLGRSARHDGRTEHTPQQNAEDMHRIIEALGASPVEMFASSGGAVSAFALVAAHPGDVTTLVAHEPPLLATLPDADRAFAAEREVQAVYHDKGWGFGMAAFIALTSWQGEFTDDFANQSAPDPASFGLPVEDDGSRQDPLLSGVSNAISAYRPDWEALASAPTRVVIAVGTESQDLLTGRTSVATARALSQEVTVFPSDHGGFLGGEFGQRGDPEAFAARLHEVLADR